MQDSKLLKTVLIVAGLVAIWIGGSILVDPVGFERSYGIELGTDINLRSEIRAPGAALLAGGLLMMSGAFVSRLAFTATLMATLWYLAYGGSRLLSFIVDGMPTSGLVQATVAELAIGLLAGFALIRFRLEPTMISSRDGVPA